MAESLKLSWDVSLESGDRAIDVQHKYLIDIINELAEAIETGEGAKAVGKILNLMQYYAEWHFEREELCMERHSCPAADTNKKAHGYFLEKFLEFKGEYRQSGGSEEIALGMYKVLTEWLVKHIKGVDAQMKTCVAAG